MTTYKNKDGEPLSFAEQLKIRYGIGSHKKEETERVY